ncbi:MAG: site-2 protease family protein [Longimicrobiales bacterium]
MEFLIVLPILLFSVVLHEVAHAQVARWEGDETAYRLGRVTLNPVPHLDLMGSLIVPVALYLLPGNFLFGWAKPVPVNPRNFRDPRWGDIRVSLAGIAANLFLAVVLILITGLLFKANLLWGGMGGVLPLLVQATYLGVFNLIPIPPLDGSHVVFHLLPPDLAVRYRAAGRYGIGILMLLLFVFPRGFALLLWPVEYLMSGVDLLLRLWV